MDSTKATSHMIFEEASYLMTVCISKYCNFGIINRLALILSLSFLTEPLKTDKVSFEICRDLSI